MNTTILSDHQKRINIGEGINLAYSVFILSFSSFDKYIVLSEDEKDIFLRAMLEEAKLPGKNGDSKLGVLLFVEWLRLCTEKGKIIINCHAVRIATMSSLATPVNEGTLSFYEMIKRNDSFWHKLARKFWW